MQMEERRAGTDTAKQGKNTNQQISGKLVHMMTVNQLYKTHTNTKTC